MLGVAMYSTQACMPAGLAAHLRCTFASVLPPGSVEHASRLVDELTVLAASSVPPGSERAAWAHFQGQRAAKSLLHNQALQTAFLAGDKTLADVLAEADARSAGSEKIFKVITGRHQQLRDATASDGDVASAWSDESALRNYAKAATEIGSRSWVQRGITWCSQLARDHFHGEGALRLALKQVAREAYSIGGVEGVSSSKTIIRETHKSLLAQRVQRPIKLIDVGSCGSYFVGSDGLDVTALDLQPQAGHPSVLQCDFLELEITPKGTLPHIEPSDACIAGSLRSLATGSFDVVVMSLVLSYLPLPTQRTAMVAQARRLLRPIDRYNAERAGPARHATVSVSAHGISVATEDEDTSKVSCGTVEDEEQQRLSAHQGGATVLAGGAEMLDGAAAAELLGEFLDERGLLLVVETMSVDRRARTWKQQEYLQNWVDVIEELGFRFLRHQILSRSHALAFLTTKLAETASHPTRCKAEQRGLPMRSRNEPLDTSVQMKLR